MEPCVRPHTVPEESDPVPQSRTSPPKFSLSEVLSLPPDRAIPRLPDRQASSCGSPAALKLVGNTIHLDLNPPNSYAAANRGRQKQPLYVPTQASPAARVLGRDLPGGGGVRTRSSKGSLWPGVPLHSAAWAGCLFPATEVPGEKHSCVQVLLHGERAALDLTPLRSRLCPRQAWPPPWPRVLSRSRVAIRMAMARLLGAYRVQSRQCGL